MDRSIQAKDKRFCVCVCVLPGEIIGMDRSLQAKDKRFSLQEVALAFDKLLRYNSNSKAARKALPDDDHGGWVGARRSERDRPSRLL